MPMPRSYCIQGSGSSSHRQHANLSFLLAIKCLPVGWQLGWTSHELGLHRALVIKAMPRGDAVKVTAAPPACEQACQGQEMNFQAEQYCVIGCGLGLICASIPTLMSIGCASGAALAPLWRPRPPIPSWKFSPECGPSGWVWRTPHLCSPKAFVQGPTF
jgi:hypothetical protein